MANCQRLPMCRSLNRQASIAVEKYVGARCNVHAISTQGRRRFHKPSQNIEYCLKKIYTALTFGKSIGV
jgi:hypothetical protein